VSREPREIFGPLAEEYARYRPTYPATLIDALLTRVGPRPEPIVDLGAGAGAAVGPLLERRARVIAVEPNRSMLAQASRRFGGREGWIGAIAAPAECLPLAPGGAACVVVAQAFHWFEPGPALAQIARALAPRGVLAILWNVTVPDAFTDEVRDLIAGYNPGYGRPVTSSMLATPSALVAHGAFSIEPPAEFPHARPMSEDAYVGYAFSWSYCGGALRGEDRDGFESRLRAAIRRHHPSGSWAEKLVAVAHFARRSGTPGQGARDH
jgi:SAM-dependent methyltransferase